MAQKAGKSRIIEFQQHEAAGIPPSGTTRATSLRLTVVLGWIGVFSIALMSCKRDPELTAQEQEGKHLYAVRCAHCHEENDLGLKKVPPDLHGVFAHTKLPSGAPATDVNVRSVVVSGKCLMPAFTGRFSEEQMTDLLAYLHTGLR